MKSIAIYLDFQLFLVSVLLDSVSVKIGKYATTTLDISLKSHNQVSNLLQVRQNTQLYILSFYSWDGIIQMKIYMKEELGSSLYTTPLCSRENRELRGSVVLVTRCTYD